MTALRFGLLALLLAGFCFRSPCSADDTAYLPATVIRVIDGDTADVRLQSGPIRIRFYGIDAPEHNQPFGLAATKALRSLIEKEELEIEPVGQDRYDRMVARVLVAGKDINAAMLARGYAWAYRKYLGQVPGAEHYCELEAEARAAGRGVWVGDPEDWQPPWDFRHLRRGDSVPAVSYAGETAARCRATIGHQTRDDAGGAAPLPGAGSPPAAGCRIKGNINSKGDRIYHVPGSPDYENTKIDESKGERWFCSVEEAREAGWRAPKN